jgi:hypothetical protein
MHFDGSTDVRAVTFRRIAGDTVQFLINAPEQRNLFVDAPVPEHNGPKYQEQYDQYCQSDNWIDESVCHDL